MVPIKAAISGAKTNKLMQFQRKVNIKKFWFLYIIMLFMIIYYAVYRYWPIILQIIISFQDYKIGSGILNSKFVGFQNFMELITINDFGRVIENTVEISVLRMLFGFFPPIIFAILLFDLKNILYKKTLQTIFYIPHFFSWVIVYSIMIAIFSGNGLISSGIVSFGGQPVNFLQEIPWFRPILIGSGVWKELGWGTIIYLAAMTSIDPELYEAAKLDGAGPIKRIKHITLPGISKVVTFFLTLSIGGLFTSTGAEQILLFYGPSTRQVADVIDTWIFRNGLSGLEYSLGATLGFAQAVIALILVLIANKVAVKVSGIGLW